MGYDGTNRLFFHDFGFSDRKKYNVATTVINRSSYYHPEIEKGIQYNDAGILFFAHCFQGVKTQYVTMICFDIHCLVLFLALNCLCIYSVFIVTSLKPYICFWYCDAAIQKAENVNMNRYHVMSPGLCHCMFPDEFGV